MLPIETRASKLTKLADVAVTLLPRLYTIREAAKCYGTSHVKAADSAIRRLSKVLEILREDYGIKATVDLNTVDADLGPVGERFTWMQHAQAALWIAETREDSTVTDALNSVPKSSRLHRVLGRSEAFGTLSLRSELDNEFCREDTTRSRKLLHFCPAELIREFMASLENEAA